MRITLAFAPKSGYNFFTMAYTSLYRRYRPSTFDEVVGQEHIVRTLRNQIKSGAVSHAYLFTGTRGTGKTSVAKIFARAVNCLAPRDGSPCGECDVCKALASPTSLDILEIDAASNNSVDQMRELTDKINFPPTVGRYKVYIIDEVHMLSKSAYNALLKTLEEPPAHAIFILATTEVQQIPATVMSRCLRFDFHLLPLVLIEKRLSEIFADIGAEAELSAVRLIASAGRGSMRDALSVADMCVSYCSGKIDYAGVLEVLGTADPFKLLGLAEHILAGDAGEALTALSALCDLGKSVPAIAADLAVMFRNMLYISTCSNARGILALPDDLFDAAAAAAKNTTPAALLSAMRIMTSLEGQFRYGTQHRTLLEAAVVEAATSSAPAAGHPADAGALEGRVAKIERYLRELSKRGFKSAPAKSDTGQVWGKVVSALVEAGHKQAAMAASDAAVEETDDTVTVRIGSPASMSLIDTPEIRAAIDKAFSAVSVKRLVLVQGGAMVHDREVEYLTEMFGEKLEVK